MSALKNFSLLGAKSTVSIVVNVALLSLIICVAVVTLTDLILFFCLLFVLAIHVMFYRVCHCHVGFVIAGVIVFAVVAVTLKLV